MEEQGEKGADPSVHLGAAGGSGFKVRCAMPRLAGIFTPGSEGLVEGEYPLKTHPHDLGRSPLTPPGQPGQIWTRVYNPQHPAKAGTRGSSMCKTSWSIAVGGSILAMCRNDDNGSIVIELTDGSLLRLSKGSDCPVPWENDEHSNLSLPQPCTHIASCKIGGQEAVLGLTERYRFYVNDIEICSNCTSFSVHDEFILLSTHAHTCRCISRSLLTKDLPSLCESKAHPFDESVRRVERGSRIVLSVPGDTKLVLQMPRGNLETIHPRALVLSAVRRYLDKLQFKEAFISMRKHRINMNLIYDHNPKLFLENVSNFLQQVESVNYINIFLMDLQEEDVTQSMYTSGYSGRDSNSSGNLGGSTKVDMVCDAVRTSLQALDSDKYFLSILTTYVKRTQPELDAALHRIKQLRDAAAGSKCQVSAEEALKYLLFLVDVNELYDVALGTYDFDLVLMVAEKSQKDPKEYLPYLNNLRRLETNYQRYTIDKHLRRYHKALKHIAKCPDHFPECLSLVNDHQLHSEALQLFAIGSQEYTSIAESYAEKLKKKRHYEEAAIIFVKAGQLQQALDCFVLCHNWRQAMCLTARLGYTQEQVADLARKMAEALADLKRPLEAGALYDEYVQDVELAITTLIDGCQWDEALRLMYKYSRTDFIESNLRTALLENQQLQVSYLASKRTEFDHHKARLAIVRDEKEKAHLQLLDSGGNFNDADADLFSDTSSATGESVRSSNYSTTSSQRSSQYSRSTGRSSKNRRKEERKKWSLKEGSRFEDLALLDALRKLIIQVDGLRVEFSSLLKALVLFDYDTQAQELQANYRDFLTHIESSLQEIWIPGGQDTAGGAAGNHLSLGPDSTANSISKAIQDGIRNQSTTAAVSDAALLVAPQLAKDIKWQINILNTEKEQ